MKLTKEAQGEKSTHPDLRPTTPDGIVDYIDKRFDQHVSVEFAGNDLITIPDDWHGAGKRGEALVRMGDILTEPIAGTNLPAKEFLSWSQRHNFSLANVNDESLSLLDAAAILEGSDCSLDRYPMLRLTRTGGKNVPIEIQFYAGGANPFLQRLSHIGNMHTSLLDKKMQDEYLLAVQSLFSPFISRGTKQERNRLGISPSADLLRRVDDCFASGVTILGDQIIDDTMRISHENLLEIVDVSVATLQAITIAIHMADRRHVPLLMRIGAPAFGLGSKEGLNYIRNALPQMRKYGAFTVGDMGQIMRAAEPTIQEPILREVRKGDASRELRLFLGGGSPVFDMVMAELEQRGKPLGWDVSIRRASRVDHGAKEWAVLISGSSLTVRTARRDKSFIRPGTQLVTHEDEPWNVRTPGLWASLGKPKAGLIPVTFVERGNPITLYLKTKSK